MVRPASYLSGHRIGAPQSPRPFVFHDYWGPGTDGDYSQVGGTVSITGTKYYRNVSLTGNAVFGPTSGVNHRAACIYVQCTLSVAAGSELRSRWLGPPMFGSLCSGGAALAAAGVGNGGVASFYTGSSFWNQSRTSPGGPGGGGGGGGVVNRGGHGGHAPSYGYYQMTSYSYGAGQIGNGNDGVNPSAVDMIENSDLDYEDADLHAGLPGSGGGGGGIDSIGTGVTTGTSGAGGNGGQAGGYLHIRARHILVAAAGGINASGVDGDDGDNAVDSANLDADCGGGAGGGGGGGGRVRILCETIDTPGNVEALGGTGGTGGVGVGGGGAGGNGAPGNDGCVSIKVVG